MCYPPFFRHSITARHSLFIHPWQHTGKEFQGHRSPFLHGSPFTIHWSLVHGCTQAKSAGAIIHHSFTVHHSPFTGHSSMAAHRQRALAPSFPAPGQRGSCSACAEPGRSSRGLQQVWGVCSPGRCPAAVSGSGAGPLGNLCGKPPGDCQLLDCVACFLPPLIHRSPPARVRSG
eukprot:scaffold73780_cov20-Tisochrysis_lutea.AAC.1